MTQIAIVKTGGKQYKVKVGDKIKVEKLASEVGKTVMLDTLLIADGQTADLELGKPSLGEKVTAKILAQDKADKIKVIKYKNKTRYKRTIGHRQPFTQLEITKIA
ncbi:MAG: 50S ribosomal protein L21 [Candidatus Falkowbacteria bacterium GW2011_GWA2_39_24]|uniref:Large ribosomal subunit protein bL21 n=1 Tax=Candidatus Falkowbacteria bacterium GW2011_GWA2_39_24 TaxID=1618634 RepID=A0A0G0NC23_9BACT|nr:MAG: 50S ribosomal protein L21 [Candidatus Falkowbacteria bacterium GW2011_GWA2_39_24]